MITQGIAPAPSRVTAVEHDVPTTMRDGTVLRCDVWSQGSPEPRPVVLLRTPYGKSSPPLATLEPARCVEHGYVAVVQDTRGCGASGGAWRPLEWAGEGPDGYDTIEWIARQSWCDGSVVMMGTSYQAIVQWLAAMEQPPHLRAIAPTMSTSISLDAKQTGGALRLDHVTSWLALTASEWIRRGGDTGDPADPGLVTEVMSLLTVEGSEVLARPVEEILDFEDFPGRLRDVVGGQLQTMPEFTLADVTVPTLSVSGWSDVFIEGTLGLHRQMKELHPGREHQLIVGPWVHGGQLTQVNGAINSGVYGSAAGGGLPARHLAFFDRHVGRTESTAGAAVRYFVMGANQWHESEAWPPPGGTEMTLPLGEDDPSSLRLDRHGDHAVRAELGPGAPSTGVTFAYDTERPFPTRGGRVLQLGLLVGGSVDQSGLVGRPDVTTWTGLALTGDLELTGNQQLRIDWEPEAEANDLHARLCDLCPDGRSMVIAEGYERPDPVQSVGRRIDVISLGPTSWRVPRGHRLQLLVTCGSHPQYARNPVLAAQGITQTRQTIYHGIGAQSAVILQVGSREAGKRETPDEARS